MGRRADWTKALVPIDGLRDALKDVDNRMGGCLLLLHLSKLSKQLLKLTRFQLWQPGQKLWFFELTNLPQM